MIFYASADNLYILLEILDDDKKILTPEPLSFICWINTHPEY